jgi:hypothetical protein
VPHWALRPCSPLFSLRMQENENLSTKLGMMQLITSFLREEECFCDDLIRHSVGFGDRPGKRLAPGGGRRGRGGADQEANEEGQAGGDRGSTNSAGGQRVSGHGHRRHAVSIPPVAPPLHAQPKRAWRRPHRVPVQHRRQAADNRQTTTTPALLAHCSSTICRPWPDKPAMATGQQIRHACHRAQPPGKLLPNDRAPRLLRRGPEAQARARWWRGRLLHDIVAHFSFLFVFLFVNQFYNGIFHQK